MKFPKVGNGKFFAIFRDFSTVFEKMGVKLLAFCCFLMRFCTPSFLAQKQGSKSQGGKLKKNKKSFTAEIAKNAEKKILK